MAQMNRPSVSASISWKFSLASQGFVTRYGENGGVFYKQFMPGGLDVPELHPPKPITKQLYDMAERAPGRILLSPSV
jgi:hypothetical protein